MAKSFFEALGGLIKDAVEEPAAALATDKGAKTADGKTPLEALGEDAESNAKDAGKSAGDAAGLNSSSKKRMNPNERSIQDIEKNRT